MSFVVINFVNVHLYSILLVPSFYAFELFTIPEEYNASFLWIRAKEHKNKRLEFCFRKHNGLNKTNCTTSRYKTLTSRSFLDSSGTLYSIILSLRLLHSPAHLFSFMAEITEIFFPDTLTFPFTIRALTISAAAPVKYGQRLLKYAFVHNPSAPSTPPETRFGSWDATFEGELKAWNVKVGDTITRERAKTRPALRLVEPCKHGVQFNGLCALCGMNMDR